MRLQRRVIAEFQCGLPGSGGKGVPREMSPAGARRATLYDVTPATLFSR
jgi:hypothetical protein